WSYLANLKGRVSHIEISGEVEGHGNRRCERSVGRLASVARGANISGSHRGRNRAAYDHLPNSLVGLVRDVQSAGGIERDPHRQIQLGGNSRDVVAVVSSHARSGNSGNDSRRRDFSNALVVGVCDIQIAE